MGEDDARLRLGQAPHLLVGRPQQHRMGLMARVGATNLPQARRDFAYHLDKALHAQTS